MLLCLIHSLLLSVSLKGASATVNCAKDSMPYPAPCPITCPTCVPPAPSSGRRDYPAFRTNYQEGGLLLGEQKSLCRCLHADFLLAARPRPDAEIWIVSGDIFSNAMTYCLYGTVSNFRLFLSFQILRACRAHVARSRALVGHVTMLAHRI